MKTYKYICVICNGRKHTAYTPRKSDYVCSPCKNARDKVNKKARSGTQSLKKRLLKKRGHTCEVCNTNNKGLIIHHKIPVSQGGQTTEDNSQLVCGGCHQNLHKNSSSLAWKGHGILK